MQVLDFAMEKMEVACEFIKSAGFPKACRKANHLDGLYLGQPPSYDTAKTAMHEGGGKMVCSSCSLENFHDTNFCSRCGEALCMGRIPCAGGACDRPVPEGRKAFGEQRHEALNDSQASQNGTQKGESPTGGVGTKILIIVAFFILIWLFMR
jgi:hypothetical protein